MAPNRKDCIDQIAGASGRKREEVNDALDEIFERASGHESDGLDPPSAYERARDEMLENLAERAAIERRARIMDTRKRMALSRYVRSTEQAIAALPGGKWMMKKLNLNATAFAIEAKLVGVNIPFFKGRLSVDAQYVALRRLWVGGMAQDLEEGGLMKVFASRSLEDKWTDELFELNKKGSPAWQKAVAAGEAGERDASELAQRGQGPGSPGVTKDAQALAIAKTVQKWQRTGMAALNREGAWIRSYSGYITKTSHDPDRIRAAGQEQWIADLLPKLDLGRTFGTRDPQKVRDALAEMWRPMAQGDHFDYGHPVEEPLYPNPAKQASAHRELHFKTGADWRAYNEEYGVHNATHTVVEAMRIAARRTALMRELGTKPREAYDALKEEMKGKLQEETSALSRKLNTLGADHEKAAAGSPERAAIGAEMEKLRAQIAESAPKLDAFKGWELGLDNRFAQIDGSSMKPTNRTAANVVANIMAVQRVSKLGNIFATHFASLPSKIMEARYWGIPFAQRYASLFHGFTQGAEGSVKREALDAVLVGMENRLGHIMSQYDVADAPAGMLHQAETAFFKLTGVNAVIDNQRGDFEAMAAAHIGGKRDLDWNAIGRKEQRVLQAFGLGEKEWKALKGVEWSKLADGRTYLFAKDAMKLSDDQVRAYLKDARTDYAHAGPSAEDIARGREELATQIAAAYSDRGGYAIPMPSARIRAILFGKDYEPGTAWNMAKKLFFQFKIWPADMITRAWGREMYGTIGDGRMDRMAGLVETAVAAVVFGVAAEGIRDLIKGHDPLAKLREHPFGAIVEGAKRSGMGAIAGDYLLGQFDRHGLSASANILGPVLGQADDLLNLLHAGGETKQGLFSEHAMRERATTLIRMGKQNTPFMNLWLTHHVTDALIWHRLQEWVNPGYLQRTEQRQRDLQGTRFWLSPAKTDAWLTGKRSSAFASTF